MDTKLKGSFYTVSEEIGNAVTHGMGALLAIVGTIVMLVHSAGDPLKITASAIYGQKRCCGCSTIPLFSF